MFPQSPAFPIVVKALKASAVRGLNGADVPGPDQEQVKVS